MEQPASTDAQSAPPIERFIWDLTYACPLRCIHCYSESGRRAARVLGREEMLRVVGVIIDAAPKRISFSGGEPLLARWWSEAARRLSAAGVPVTLFTSGWLVDEHRARELGRSVASVAVSVDGPNERVHDYVRGRRGSFRRAMAALEILGRIKREKSKGGESCYALGIDYTVTRSGNRRLERFVENVTSWFPEIDFIRFGAVVPEGLAQERSFARELLDNAELIALGASERRLASHARNGSDISVTDARYFLPNSPLSAASATIAHIEPDGELRAFTTYEAKVGNVLEERLDVLWKRAIAWRQDPFVAQQLCSIRTVDDWARATRALDRRYGSEADKARIERRGKVRV
jgi:MoaA/NifB/PqqE/SkfB family radical SAM enzyme